MWTLKSVSSTLSSTSEAYFRRSVISAKTLCRTESLLTRTDGQYMLMTMDLSVCEHEKRGVIIVV